MSPSAPAELFAPPLTNATRAFESPPASASAVSLQPPPNVVAAPCVARLQRGGQVAISARVRNAALELDVESPSSGGLPVRAGDGVGLSNARERLRLLFGDRASLSLEEIEGRVAAQLRIPVAT
jgi:hypothetical protein